MWDGADERPASLWTQSAELPRHRRHHRARARKTGRARRRAIRERRSSAASVPCTVSTTGTPVGVGQTGGHPPVGMDQVGAGGDFLRGPPRRSARQSPASAPQATGPLRRGGNRSAVGEVLSPPERSVTDPADRHAVELAIAALALVARRDHPHVDAAPHQRAGERAERGAGAGPRTNGDSCGSGRRPAPLSP